MQYIGRLCHVSPLAVGLPNGMSAYYYYPQQNYSLSLGGRAECAVRGQLLHSNPPMTVSGRGITQRQLGESSNEDPALNFPSRRREPGAETSYSDCPFT